MKKYLIFSVIFVFFVSFYSGYSYSYESCNNYIDYPKEVNTNNLNEYLIKFSFNEVYSFCSNEKCYNIRESNLKKSLNNFHKLYDKTLTEEEYQEVYVKGYPITKIIGNNCK